MSEISWRSYLEYLIKNEEGLNKVKFSIDGGNTYIDIPTIIRITTYMIATTIKSTERNQVIVFPEKNQSLLLFSISYLLYSMMKGDVLQEYDVHNFKEGEILKIGNAVVEFIGLEWRDGEEWAMYRLADGVIKHRKISAVPFLQRTNTKKKLSSNKLYRKEIKKFDDMEKQDLLTMLKNYKTHMASSIYCITPLAPIKETIGNCRIGNEKLDKLLMLTTAHYDGKIQNIGGGQAAGIPAVVYMSDLYTANAVLDEELLPRTIIIDISNTNSVLGQLDELDELLKKRIPIICLTDTMNSIDELEMLTDRGFKIWRWDARSITNQLYQKGETDLERKVFNCAKQKINYITSDNQEIFNALKKLSLHRKETQELSPKIMKVYSNLNRLSFISLRSIIPFDDVEINDAQKTLEECVQLLNDEKKYVSNEIYVDFLDVINCLKIVFRKEFELSKIHVLESILKENYQKRICIIIPEKVDRNKVLEYWNHHDYILYLKYRKCILYPREYFSLSKATFDETIVISWFRRTIMRKIIYSYNSESYSILLYDYENRWRKRDVNCWQRVLSKSNNQEIVKKGLKGYDFTVSTDRLKQDIEEKEIPEVIDDEQDEIEQTLRENAVRRYTSSGNSYSDVDAIPVSFVGGLMAFYRTGHKVTTVTSIILENGDSIKLLLPSELRIGDFVILRESDKDIIRDLADIILKNSGKENLRSLASKWKEVLEIEMLFSTEEDFYNRMVSAGCTKGYATIRRWIEEDDIIAPQQKQDLQFIAEVTGSEVLDEMIDKIYDAAQIVKSAHSKAGRILSIQLQKKVAEELQRFGKIDPYNFGEPIEIGIDEIGTVKILKVTDIGSAVRVDVSNTNRLIEE